MEENNKVMEENNKVMEENNKVMEDILQLVSFKIGSEIFGVEILRVKEIIRMLQVTKVPNSPDYVDGVVNLRGNIIPVVDLRSRLNMVRKQYDKNSRIIVVELKTSVVGFVVDEVDEVLRIPRSITEPPPSMVAGIDSDYITAVGKLEDRIITLLDIDKVLSV